MLHCSQLCCVQVFKVVPNCLHMLSCKLHNVSVVEVELYYVEDVKIKISDLDRFFVDCANLILNFKVLSNLSCYSVNV